MKKIISFFAIVVFCAARLSAQYAYDKEKIYIHTDHVFFAPGGTVFYKLYLVRGADNKPSGISHIAYVEILGPSGAVVEKQTYEVENGYTEGSYTLGEQAAGGIYKLRAYTNWMRNEKDSGFFTKSLTVQNIIAPRVLMKLDFDRKGYGPGDEVKADFSMRSLDNAPVKYYKGEFTVSLGGDVKKNGSFTTDASGKARLSFGLPQSLSCTDGLLNITVNYDAHTESIARSIPITLNKIDLQFLPEGGAMVAGLSTHIAFKAINEFGKPVDVKGVILDNNNQVVASFDSYKFGMGEFPFTPVAGARYTGRIMSPAGIRTLYPLPLAAAGGAVMNCSKKAGNITIKCNTTADMAVTLIGRTKGIKYYSKDLMLKKGINDDILREDLFPPGIAQFTLYAGGRPLAERLVFLNGDRQLHVTLSTDKQVYLPREKVRMTLTTRDEHGQPVPSNFSLSVVDDKLWTLADDRQDNILSWLLMSSELRSPIEEPAFYFKAGEPKAAMALDLVMLTNGYRYFDFIDDVIRNKKLKYSPDEGNVVSGVVTNDKGRAVQATVYLVNNIVNGKALKLETGPDGLFYFPHATPGEKYLLIAKSIHARESIKIQLQQTGIGYNPLRGVAIKQLQVEKVNLGIELGKKSLALNEVVVIGYGVQYKRNVTGAVVAITAADLKAVRPEGMMQALEGKIAGLEVTPAIQIRGARSLNNGHEPLIVVDGVPQERYDLSHLILDDIESVTVFKDAMAVDLFGARAANGVIVIQSKSLVNEKLRWNLTKNSHYASAFFTMKGPSFAVARRFYAPKYESTVTDKRNDYRETIYWNPVVQTDRNGHATVEFYNSDATTTFRAIAEGIGYNGGLGRADTTYVAKSAMSVDAKIPPYLTVGDQALIPVVIKNNSRERLEATMAVNVPDNMFTGDFDRSITLEAGASRQVLVPLSAAAPTSGKIRISISGNLSNETVELSISASGKGFPVRETLSGNASASHDLSIGPFVPGSLHARLTLYKDLEGQLMEGIESMLQEPYGCFEQTSSATYPNIFILKYLRQAGKSNPAIEQKAMSYIEHGYKRLIGFETSENGFEWFGHAPAHAALTAYGLLEFTDMQEFLKVDENMLQRTKDFLLRRRDGAGGFKVSAGGYDRFRDVPNKIANIYIVYAMTQAGYGADIRPEYEAAVKKALESNDGYQLAMMALAASNMKNEGDYRQLMEQLHANYQESGLSALTSVVNSRDISLRVETMSLYALALMRDLRPDIGAVAALISNILSKKSYYGYGSTQGTILALEAITEYGKLMGKQARATDIRLTVNGRVMAPEDSIAALLHAGENVISVDYMDKGRGVPYNLEVSYQTLTPPTSAKAEMLLNTTLSDPRPTAGQAVRMTVSVTNSKDSLQPMVIAKIGIPAGLSLQPWQLKELMDQKKVAYYEIFDNYLVMYWMGFAGRETKTIQLDVKAEIPGKFKAKASNVYLYYTPEAKYWKEGVEVEVAGSRE